MALAVGDLAPDFTLKDQYAQDVSLSALLKERAVLIVFYPFAFSGVCPGELNGFRDRLGDVETEASTIVAISCDPIYAQRAFADRDALFFPLLSDFWPQGSVASAYDVFEPQIGAATRSSYLVGRDGTVQWSVHNDLGDARDLDAHAVAIRALD